MKNERPPYIRYIVLSMIVIVTIAIIVLVTGCSPLGSDVNLPIARQGDPIVVVTATHFPMTTTCVEGAPCELAGGSYEGGDDVPYDTKVIDTDIYNVEPINPISSVQFDRLNADTLTLMHECLDGVNDLDDRSGTSTIDGVINTCNLTTTSILVVTSYASDTTIHPEYFNKLANVGLMVHRNVIGDLELFKFGKTNALGDAQWFVNDYYENTMFELRVELNR